jgi:hypothetical protein
MKKILISLLFAALTGTILYAQGGDSWLYRVNFVPQSDCPQGEVCPNEVKVDVNFANIPDSCYIWLKIGSTAGASDIYSKKIGNYSSMSAHPGFTTDSQGNTSISLGKYVVGDNFYVDMEIIEDMGQP